MWRLRVAQAWDAWVEWAAAAAEMRQHAEQRVGGAGGRWGLLPNRIPSTVLVRGRECS